MWEKIVGDVGISSGFFVGDGRSEVGTGVDWLDERGIWNVSAWFHGRSIFFIKPNICATYQQKDREISHGTNHPSPPVPYNREKRDPP